MAAAAFLWTTIASAGASTEYLKQRTLAASEGHTPSYVHQENTDAHAATAMSSRRRSSILLAVAALLPSLHVRPSLADEPANNGWWLTEFPLPETTVTNKLNNESTGTRTFLRKGIYIADLSPAMRSYRLKQHAFDLLALGDMVGSDAWNYFLKYLCQKATVMYYDFDTVITAAPAELRPPLTELANRLFDSIEKLEEVAKQRDLPATRARYGEAEVIFQEVMAKMG